MNPNLPKEATEELRTHLKRLKELADLSGDPEIRGEAETALDVANLSVEFRSMIESTATDVAIFERSTQFATENNDVQVDI